ncbi:hypothetical protein DFH08DRAFT_821148 [Mycena albidolilacea]|uniref:Uncharacterized protein n=1 Tax=Mycena albidolilacea TaxID=1033008 RepID=A0AAD7EDY5_9AGAR|nr:hypothetical protein DFH08DRAFT_821148 [Mycena albidolilacea]
MSGRLIGLFSPNIPKMPPVPSRTSAARHLACARYCEKKKEELAEKSPLRLLPGLSTNRQSQWANTQSKLYSTTSCKPIQERWKDGTWWWEEHGMNDMASEPNPKQGYTKLVPHIHRRARYIQNKHNTLHECIVFGVKDNTYFFGIIYRPSVKPRVAEGTQSL